MAKVDRGRWVRAVRRLREGRPTPDDIPTHTPAAELDSANSVWLSRLAAAAFSALVVAVLASRHPGRSPGHDAVPSSAMRTGASSGFAGLATLDGLPLEVGAPIAALEVPRLVDHPGRARWTLGPRSLARLLPESDGVLRVELEHGTLAADVQPGSGRPTFAVLAGGTEVRGHGTHFQVSLDADLARVSVSTGEVQVRPLGTSGGIVLRAGSLQRFRAGLPIVEPEPVAETAPPP
jgi:FecR-like protein